jgi:hypothetical protein
VQLRVYSLRVEIVAAIRLKHFCHTTVEEATSFANLTCQIALFLGGINATTFDLAERIALHAPAVLRLAAIPVVWCLPGRWGKLGYMSVVGAIGGRRPGATIS